jgi:hypothetical protein
MAAQKTWPRNGSQRTGIGEIAGAEHATSGGSLEPRQPALQRVIERMVSACAALRIRFGDLGLINGSWPILGKIANWNRAEWPLPEFVRRDPLSNKAWLVRRSDTDPGKIVFERPIDFDSPLENDSVSGYGAVEIKPTKLIG